MNLQLILDPKSFLNSFSHLPISHSSNSLFVSAQNPKCVPVSTSISGFHRAAKTASSYRNLRPLIRTKLASSSLLSHGVLHPARSRSASEASISFGNSNAVVKVRCAASGAGSETDDVYYMRKTVELARTAIGCTSPNPMVGCVIVKDGKIVGQGFHPKAGQPHAEVFALRDAGELAENATAYVSLEPCNHHGRTPPCTEALIKVKVKKVVVGMVDPNPIVTLTGINRLRNAGIEVTVGVEGDLCKKLLEAYTHKMLTGKPFVTLRYSMSVNGSLLDEMGEGAMEPGGYYSRLLQEHDAVVQSFIDRIKDFPLSKEPGANQPLHILVAKNSDLPISIPKLGMKEAMKMVIFSSRELTIDPETAMKSVETVIADHLSLDAILDYCIKQGSCSVLVDLRRDFNVLEEILRKGIERKLVQKIMVEILPVWAGDEANIPSALTSQMLKLGVKNMSARTLGRNVLLEGYL